MAESNNDWVKVTDRLPESEKPVEITFRWKNWYNPDEYWYGTCNAFYEDGSIPVGWHEDVWFMEESYQIDESQYEIVAWKEKCKPYKEN